MIKVGIIFKQVYIIKFLIQYHFIFVFVSCHTSIRSNSLCEINESISESYNSDVQPIWKQNLEQMDSSNTGMSYEVDILLLNFWLTKSGIS